MSTTIITRLHALGLARAAFAWTMGAEAVVQRRRCTPPVLELAADPCFRPAGVRIMRDLEGAGLVAWRNGWRCTPAGIAALAEHLGGPVFWTGRPSSVRSER